MSQSEQPIDEIKPDADLQEQERPEVETPDDPELLVPPVPEAHPIEADPVDAPARAATDAAGPCDAGAAWGTGAGATGIAYVDAGRATPGQRQ